MVNFKKKLLSSAMAAALVGGGVGLISNTASAIEIAADHTGQALIGAVYVAEARHATSGEALATGVTNIKIVNPSTTHAVKARIAFRSKVDCVEVLDFVLYLTPADVWYGSIEINSNGEAALVTDDDSVHNLPNGDSWASVAGNAVNIELFDENLAAGDYNEMGMFEVIGAYSVTNTINVPSDGDASTPDSVRIFRTMAKPDLARIFDAGINQILSLNSCNNGAIAGCNIRTDEPSSVQLRGEVEMNLTVGGQTQTFSYMMTAIDNGTSVVSSVDGSSLVIRNPVFDVVAASSLDMGKRFITGSQDSFVEIERLLAASSVASTYDNSNIVFITFPLKYSHYQRDVTGGNWWSTPYNTTGSVNYSITHYDNQENSVEPPAGTVVSGGPVTTVTIDTINSCVEWFIPSWRYSSGWYSLNLYQSSGSFVGYQGIPALSYTMDFNASKFLPNTNYQSNTNLENGTCTIDGTGITVSLP